MRLRSLVVVTPPTVEPVSLREAKAQLGLVADQQDDDELIVSQIATARRLCEQRLGVALAVQQLRARWEPSADGWRITADGRGVASLILPRTPALSGGSYTVAVDVDGVAIPGSGYTFDTDAGEIRFTSRPIVPDAGTLTVTYWAGPVGRVAPQIRSAILLTVGHLFLHREAVVTGTIVAELPLAVDALLASESVTGRY